MTYYQYSDSTAANIVTKLNNEGVVVHNVVAIVHDGTEFVVFYYK